jgi:hypothetical protein
MNKNTPSYQPHKTMSAAQPVKIQPSQPALAQPAFKPVQMMARPQHQPPAAFARVGGSAIQGTLPPGSIQRMKSLHNKSNAVQPKMPAGVDAFQVNLQRKSGGWTLPKEVQTKMESALGADFSDVRIHVGSEVTSVGAIAFTWGTDIHFAPGHYNPHSIQGQQLLGHELTHVLQQRAGRVRNPFGSGTAVVQDHALEAEADRMGMKAAMHSMPR